MREAPPLDSILEGLYRGRGDPRIRSLLSEDLAEHSSAVVAAELVARFDRALEPVWEGGWQPADLIRLVGRDRSKLAVQVLRHAIASQAAEYEQWGSAVAPEWMAQLEEIAARPVRDPGRPWPLLMAKPLPDVVIAGMEVLTMLRLLPRIPRLMPPPSQWPDRSRPTSAEGRFDPGMLAKIRGLLAKAESTGFDAEAEAFTAKAQELMTRHRIDRARLDADAPSSAGDAIGRRMGVDPPYARAKFMLVGGIARANSCRAVWSKGFGFATVFGYPEDVDAVEELYTSLLVQATSALQREGSRDDVDGPGSIRRFRRSFLIGFAYRVTERLREANEETVRTVAEETGRELVPILESRERAAEEAMNATHANIKGMSISITDGEGYQAGTRLADQADLGLGPEELAGFTARLPR